MIKVMKSLIISPAFKGLVIAFTLYIESSWAITLQANITGDKIQWLNASQSEIGGYLVPSAWQPMSDLMPTREWVPGGYLDSGSDFIFTSGGVEVSIPGAKVSGTSYKYPSGFDVSGESSVFPVCSESVYDSSSQVDVFGIECVGDKTLLLSTESTLTPFLFARPIISGFDDKKVVEAFTGSPEGTYTATVYVKPAYAFRHPVSDVWTYRYANSVPVTIVIDYQPAELASVTIMGSGVIPALYNTTDETITGKTSYLVKAEGVFPGGLRLTFEDRDYSLIKSESGRNKKAIPKIPYEIKCNECEDFNIVNDGSLEPLQGSSADGNWTLAYDTASDGEIYLNLELGYMLEKSDLSEISSGTYHDVFTVIFEANL